MSNVAGAKRSKIEEKFSELQTRSKEYYEKWYESTTSKSAGKDAAGAADKEDSSSKVKLSPEVSSSFYRVFCYPREGIIA